MSSNIDYELTAHAQAVVTERKISIAWIEQVLAHPAMTHADKSDTDLQHLLARISAHNNRVLRVICNIRSKPWRVVTVYFDRTMRDKL